MSTSDGQCVVLHWQSTCFVFSVGSPVCMRVLTEERSNGLWGNSLACCTVYYHVNWKYKGPIIEPWGTP